MDGYSTEDLLEFLVHASERGLMPAATAGALAVSVRNVFGVLDPAERADIRRLDMAAVAKRFNNKRAKDFSPTSLKEYARRVQRAVDLFIGWKTDPANFTVKTRATSKSARKDRQERGGAADAVDVAIHEYSASAPASRAGSYQSAFPVRPGHVVSLANIPDDLTREEAERLATFVKMLAAKT